MIKQYKHNEFVFYYNNKNNKIIYNKSLKLKTINNHKEQKCYNKFLQLYIKIIIIYKENIHFLYCYKIQQYFIYIYKIYNYIIKYNIKKLYSNHYSIMFLLYINFAFIYDI